MFRQGDVFLIEVSELPNEIVQEEAKERIVLAYGEVTGHAHAIKADKAVLYAANDNKYLRILEDCALTHEEHSPIPLKKDKFYKVVIQKHYTPEEIRYVAD